MALVQWNSEREREMCSSYLDHPVVWDLERRKKSWMTSSLVKKKDVAEHWSMFRVRMKVIVEESVQVRREEKV